MSVPGPVGEFQAGTERAAGLPEGSAFGSGRREDTRTGVAGVLLSALFLAAAAWGGEPPARQADPSGAPSGLQIERTVHAVYLDWLGRKREVERRETVLVKGSNLVIHDLTYGEKLILRTDQKKVWSVDPLGGHYSEYSFDEVAAIRKAAMDELRSVKAHVPGTKDEKGIDDLLEGYDQFPAAPKVELVADQTKREVVLNGMFVRASFEIDPKTPPGGYFEALASIGAFPPAMTEVLRTLGGLPVKGRIRYVLFMDRVIEDFEVTSVKAKEVTDSDFEIPPGLAKVPLKGFGRPPERKPLKPAQFRPDFSEDGEKPPEKKK